jgi:uncharacterized protein (DUF433 family)
MSTVSYPHIEVRENGKAYIEGTGFKVRILVEEYLSGMRPEDMEREHPPLTLSQIHAALTYYYDHKQEFDKEIDGLDQVEQRLRSQFETSPVAEKLRQAMTERKGRG